MLTRLKNLSKVIWQTASNVHNLNRRIELLALAVSRIESRQVLATRSSQLHSYEFQTYSQWGEDGILAVLTEKLPLHLHRFVEFGVEDYSEANTRLLLEAKQWRGLVIDGSVNHIQGIRNSPMIWRNDLQAVQAFITCENINQTISDAGFSGEIGVLSVDIDGNDYWVWKAITAVDPAVVVVEYNHRFGGGRAVTVPYQPDFIRSKAHYSNLYFGASLAALVKLGKLKGYVFVGCNSAGNDAFFVKPQFLPEFLTGLSAEEGYVAGTFRESRTPSGALALLSPEQEQELLRPLPVVEV